MEQTPPLSGAHPTQPPGNGRDPVRPESGKITLSSRAPAAVVGAAFSATLSFALKASGGQKEDVLAELLCIAYEVFFLGLLVDGLLQQKRIRNREWTNAAKAFEDLESFDETLSLFRRRVRVQVSLAGVATLIGLVCLTTSHGRAFVLSAIAVTVSVWYAVQRHRRDSSKIQLGIDPCLSRSDEDESSTLQLIYPMVRYLFNDTGQRGPPRIVFGAVAAFLAFFLFAWVFLNGHGEIKRDYTATVAFVHRITGGGSKSQEETSAPSSTTSIPSSTTSVPTTTTTTQSGSSEQATWKCGNTTSVAESLVKAGMDPTSASDAAKAADAWGNYLSCPATVQRSGGMWSLPVNSSDGPSLVVVNPPDPNHIHIGYPNGVPVDFLLTPVVEANLPALEWVYPRFSFSLGTSYVLEYADDTCSLLQNMFPSPQLDSFPRSVSALLLARTNYTWAMPVLTGTATANGTTTNYSFIDVASSAADPSGYVKEGQYTVTYNQNPQDPTEGVATLDGTSTSNNTPCPSIDGLSGASKDLLGSINHASPS